MTAISDRRGTSSRTGRLPVGNTASERELRQAAVGRANYLFAGSDQGGERAAIASILISTCMLAEIDPLAYLANVFQKLADGWPNHRLGELLPPRLGRRAQVRGRLTPLAADA
ncbi:MAG: transposase domain-containing protein [Anaeromyxobacter sp.]